MKSAATWGTRRLFIYCHLDGGWGDPMNRKRFQGVQRLVVVIGLLFILLEMAATPVPAAHADFPAGVGFDGSAWLDSENPPYFTNTSATFLNPYAVKGTASYTWP